MNNQLFGYIIIRHRQHPPPLSAKVVKDFFVLSNNAEHGRQNIDCGIAYLDSWGLLAITRQRGVRDYETQFYLGSGIGSSCDVAGTGE
jgi:hypothetical protein